MYNHMYIGTAAVPYSSFGNLWIQLATHYISNQKVFFGLMNEPHDLPTEQWLTAANVAIAGIRSTGATNLITVPGNAYTGAHSWLQSVNGNTASGSVMLGVVDPLNNYIYEVHEYLDSDYSGTHTTCAGPTFGSQGLAAFTGWARTNGKRAILGEFAGTSTDPTCTLAIQDMLTYIIQNQDVYVGWTWWAGGPLWGTYMFDLEPGSSTNAALMSVLQPFIGATTMGTLPIPSAGTPIGSTAPNTAAGGNLQANANKPNTGTIAGAVVGSILGALLIAGAVVAFILIRKRRNIPHFSMGSQSSSTWSPTVTPPPIPSSPSVVPISRSPPPQPESYVPKSTSAKPLPTAPVRPTSPSASPLRPTSPSTSSMRPVSPSASPIRPTSPSSARPLPTPSRPSQSLRPLPVVRSPPRATTDVKLQSGPPSHTSGPSTLKLPVLPGKQSLGDSYSRTVSM